MKGNNQLFNNILEKLEKLIEERNTLRERVAELTLENHKLKSIENNKNEKHKTVDNRISIEEERLIQLKEAFKQLDQYTKELDECIQWIEKN